MSDEPTPQPAAVLDADLARRRRAVGIITAVGAIGVVVAIVVAIVINSGGSSKKPAASVAQRTAPTAALASVLGPVTSVPVSTLDQIGLGKTVAIPKPVTGAALTANGKPELLFIGAEFCPYCAGERWSMAVALSRFGTLHDVTTTESSGTDLDPNTQTLDFVKATYDSKYLAFVPVEAEDRFEQSLVNPTKAQNTLWNKYSNNRPGFPFLDFGNKLVALGPTFDPAVLAGLTRQQIADQLADPNSPVAQAVDGAANVLTASICEITNGQPGNVCGDSAITAVQSRIDGSSST